MTKTLHEKRGRPRKDWMHDTAARLGVGIRSLQLDLARGEKISHEVLRLVRGTKLDRGAYLDRLARLGHDEQIAMALRDLAEGEAMPASHLSALQRAWLHASDDERTAFRRWIEP